jgi:hypothetical protein
MHQVLGEALKATICPGSEKAKGLNIIPSHSAWHQTRGAVSVCCIAFVPRVPSLQVSTERMKGSPFPSSSSKILVPRMEVLPGAHSAWRVSCLHGFACSFFSNTFGACPDYVSGPGMETSANATPSHGVGLGPP